MQLKQPRYYHFTTVAQWQAGVADRLDISDAGLKSASSLEVVPIQGTSAADSTSALALDPCGTAYWVRENTFEFIGALPKGIQRLGQLNINPDEWKPAKLSIGTYRLWLLVHPKKENQHPRIFRYFVDTFQRLAHITVNRNILDMIGDGEDGVWLLLGGDSKSAELKHLDQSGNALQQFDLGNDLTAGEGWLAINDTHDTLFVLDVNPEAESCDQPHNWCESYAWRIRSVDTCKGEINLVLSQPCRDPVCNRNIPDFRPDMFVVDSEGRIHALASNDSVLYSYSQTGQVLAEIPGITPEYSLPIKAFVDNGRLLVATAAGIAELRETGTACPASDSLPTYISPMMVSPEGAQQGWVRADLNVDFGPGSAIEVSVASTKDQQLIKQAGELFTNKKLSNSARLNKINTRLPWARERTIIYQGGEWPPGSSPRFPLQEVEDTHLWLRVRIYTTAGAQPPKLNTLRVFYPNVSYARYLPAVYQESKQATKTIRRLLSVFESLFGDLDAQLAELPGRIDPKTAPNDWLPYLLSWLGLPVPTELEADEQRELLKNAPTLLRDRGTKSALIKLLELLVGKDNDFTVEDNSEGPALWVLPKTDRDSESFGPRLGCDTLVLMQKQPGFYLGESSLLGSQSLGYSTLDLASLFARTSGLITLSIAASAADRERLEPLIQRYLPYFIPAHCRYALHFVAADELHKSPIIDSKLRLKGKTLPRLSEDTRIGHMQLEPEKGGGISLDHSMLLDDGPYLT